MNKFSQRNEQDLLSQVREVQAHISDGLSPTDAVVKTAEHRRTHPDMLPLLVQSTNLGRQAYQQEKAAGQGVLGLLGEYPLANLDDVRSRLYPPAAPSAILKSAAVSDVYSEPPREPVAPRVKRASAIAPAEPRPIGDAHTRARWREGVKMSMERTVRDADVAVEDARYKFSAALSSLVGYFQRNPDASVADARYGSLSLFGKRAEAIFDVIPDRSRQPVATTKQALAVAATDQPFSLVAEVLRTADAHADAIKTAAELKQGRAERLERLQPFTNGAPASSTPVPASGSPLLKAGSWLNPLLTGASAGLASNLRSRIDPAAQAAGIESQLDDPEHLDELRGIQTRAMLADLMNNDPVLKGYDPEEFTNAFNELVQLSPSAADQPALMRPLLRKRLTAGATEPFDAQQIADIEKTVQQIRPQAGRAHGPAMPTLG
jgi:hypothetical protein